MTEDIRETEDVQETDTQQTEERRLAGPRNVVVTLAVVGLVLIVVLGVLLAIWLGRNGQNDVDTNGIEVERIITGPGKGDHPKFERPGGVAFGRQGEIYVADTGNDRIAVFDSRGKFLREFGGRGIAKASAGASATWEPGLLNYPLDVALDATGTVYVADFYNDCISVFGADGRFQRRFPDPYRQVGKGGSGQGGTGIAVTAVTVIGDKVYATDTFQIFVFSLSGDLIEQFGRPGADREGLDHPNGVAADSAGNLYVADSNNNRVKAYGAKQDLLWVHGSRVSDLRSESQGAVVLPRGMAIERGGSVLIADTLGQQLVRLGQDGKVLASYGAQGTEPGLLNFPNDVATRGDLVLIADKANDRVQVVKLSDR